MNSDPETSGGSQEPFQVLIRRARDGDREAIGEVVDRWRDYLLLIANEDFDKDLQPKMGPSDIVQQSMIQAQDKIREFRGVTEAEFRGWVRQILRNLMEDARRRFKTAQARNVNREIKKEHSSAASIPIADSQITPGTQALMRERAELLQRALKKIPFHYQQVIQMRNWDELGFAEIAEKLNSTEDGARKMWYRAVLRLQEEICRANPDLHSGPTKKPR